MSRTKTSPSLFAVALHSLLVLITGGLWLIPLCIRLMLKESSLFAIALHSIATLMTGGFWLIVLVIWYMLSKKN